MLRAALLDLGLWTLSFPLRGLLCRLPVPALDAIGDVCGEALFRLKTGEREALVRFARLLAPGQGPQADRRARDVARQGLRLFSKRQLEILCCQRLNAAYVADLVTFEGLDHLRAALALGRGVVAVTAHFGPFLLGPMALGVLGFPVTQLTGPRRADRLTPIQARVAAARNRRLDALPLSFQELGGHLKTIFRLLKQNSIVVVAFDGRESKDFEPVDFLGRKAHFSSGPFRLADRVQAPVLPLFSYRETGGRSRVVIGPALPLPRDAAGGLDARAATQAFATLFEKRVAARPDHFVTTLLNMDRDIRLGIVKTPIFGQEP
ncbi:lipid A biosynthesis acyltransferase [Solidesulfovibrio carbinoliphilus subsp. oakridgensis]|uniref:Lipid A biosynthesis acyltransferase n=1 Tax=Solidesulfovibrio carbinoliphilus subsp. oakridgensis TaxID=694327 RepID=G7Q6H5_9BACT|nr:lysophospholipid acyltransferase family protein [Solidesulfovibrio carbinoliphilus]EHJ47588.1 lipid A biosynthesis acyltransferase [Solidesulfovibrio carbinoliphilus subsp. oakridgensis]